MQEREIIKKHYYKIPLNEKVYLYSKRATILLYYLIRYKLRKIVPSKFEKKSDVFKIYFTKHELSYVKRKLNIKENNIQSAVKILTYFHTLSGVTGYISEMNEDRIVRIETHCPLQNIASKEFCSEAMSYPTFCAICNELNPDIVHTHEKYLSNGDDTCTMVFEYKK